MRACGQKLVKVCTLTHTLTHTHAAKLVVEIIIAHSYRTHQNERFGRSRLILSVVSC